MAISKLGRVALALSLVPLPTLAADPKVPIVSPAGRHYLSQPLVTQIYTADPSAHVFNGKIYVYPSHDVPTEIPDDDLGNQYAMHDYRVLEMDRIGGPVKIGPVALDVKDVPWASQQMWAPDAATSFLRVPVEMRALIEAAGFRARAWDDVTIAIAESEPNTVVPTGADQGRLFHGSGRVHRR